MENKKTILDETGVVDEKQKVQNIKTDEDNHPINIKLKELESALTFSTSLSPAEKKDLEQRVGSIIKDPAPVSEETIMNKLEEILQITTNRSFKKEQAVGVSNEKPKRKLTEEAEHLLEDYKRIPILNSKNFKKIAEENGIVLEQKDKPEDIIQKLINKRDEKEAVEEKVEEKTEIFAPKTQEMKKDEEKAIEKKEIGISFIELRAKRESLL